MSSTGLSVDPLTSTDGTPVDVEKVQGRKRLLASDDQVIDILLQMNDTLGKILLILATEFEQEQELLSGIED